jgi:hypothetical protein
MSEVPSAAGSNVDRSDLAGSGIGPMLMIVVEARHFLDANQSHRPNARVNRRRNRWEHDMDQSTAAAAVLVCGGFPRGEEA